MRWRLGAVAGALALLSLPVTAAPSATAAEASRTAKPRIAMSLGGARPVEAELCGATRRTFTAGQGDRVKVRLRLKRVRARQRKARRRLKLTVERCVAGRWSATRGAGVVRARPGRLVTLPLSTGTAGELRLRAATRIGRSRIRSRPIYLRIVPEEAPAGDPPVVDIPVTFTVRNVNRSAVSCSADGEEYAIAGRLIGPTSPGEAGVPAAATLYLHEFSFGKFFWRFPDPAYDYATEQAKEGHTSVIVDRLGYDDSPGPHGRQVCIGSQADMAHQMITQLRDGAYAAGEDLAPRRFERIALAGHSIGGMIAEVASYSFGEVDALLLFAWADQGFSGPALYSAFVEQGSFCTRGGEPAEPGAPSGYAYTTPTREGFIRHVFFDAEPEVIERTAEMRNRDPCGDVGAQPAAIASNNARIGELTIPVLLLYGRNDWIFDQPAAGEAQREAFASSEDVTMHMIESTGHALTLERSAPQTRALVAEWLAQRGF